MGTIRHHALQVLIGTAAVAASAQAGTLNVPGDASTIQGAIDIAGSGDTILVAPGTWTETIDLSGKKLVLQGTGGAAVTIIDGAGGGPVVMVNGAEPAGTALRGFTITGGAAGQMVFVDGQFPFLGFGGAGIFVGEQAHLEVRDCIVTGNVLPTSSGNYGGGVATFRGAVTFIDTELSFNTAWMGGAFANMLGGGEVTLLGCTITHNGPNNAIRFTSSNFSAADCLFADNAGTGLSVNGVGPFTGCTFSGNTGWGLTGFSPVGLDVYDCTFLDNDLGAMSLSGSTINTIHFVKRCTFGPGQTLEGTDRIEVDACTFDGAHIESVGGSPVVVENSIARNMGTFVLNASSVQVSYSDVQGGAPGTGNIDVDPQWVNAAAHDYNLQPTSPCIDTADPAALLDADLTRADMGSHTFAAWDDLGGAVSAYYDSQQRLAGQGLPVPGETVGLRLSSMPALQSTILVVGLDALQQVYKDGVIWPSFDLLIPGVLTSPEGQLWLTSTWPTGVPSGPTIRAQFWFKHAGFSGLSASNGVRLTLP